MCVCEEQLLRPSHTLDYFPSNLSVCSDLSLNDAFLLRENHVVCSRRVKSLHFSCYTRPTFQIPIMAVLWQDK